VQVQVNGEDMDVDEGATIGALLAQLGLGAKWVLVERNGEPVPRAEMPTLTLQGGDRLELVRAVAGG
jgi:sulfur carrier protein